MENLSGSFKEATAEAGAGGLITYTLHLINSGDKLVENVQLIDPLPAGTTYDSHDPGAGSNTFNYNPTLNQMEWTGNLAPDEELVFHFWATVDDPLPPMDVITNTATVEWNSELLQLSAATTILKVALDESYKQAAVEAEVGELITYTIHLVNSGNIPAEQVQLTDPLPDGTTYDHGAGDGFTYNPTLNQMEWTGVLTPTEELVFQFWVKVSAHQPPPKLITNTATLEWNGTSLQLGADTRIVGPAWRVYLPIIKH